MKPLQLTGQQFGRWTVLGKDPNRGTTKRRCTYWLCKCKCGRILSIKGSSLTSDDSHGCWQCAGDDRAFNEIGKKYGRLTVIAKITEVIPLTERGPRYLVRCDCGVELERYINALRTGNTKSCGCLKSQSWKEELARRKRVATQNAAHTMLVRIFHSYKNRAKKGGLPFTLSVEQFKVLIFSPCYYCGSKPLNYEKHRYSDTKFNYNGIDRVDNPLGYTPENCVTACKRCNCAKNDLSRDEFNQWIRAVYWNFYVGKMGGTKT